MNKPCNLLGYLKLSFGSQDFVHEKQWDFGAVSVSPDSKSEIFSNPETILRGYPPSKMNDCPLKKNHLQKEMSHLKPTIMAFRGSTESIQEVKHLRNIYPDFVWRIMSTSHASRFPVFHPGFHGSYVYTCATAKL